jgi:endonuclease I
MASAYFLAFHASDRFGQQFLAGDLATFNPGAITNHPICSRRIVKAEDGVCNALSLAPTPYWLDPARIDKHASWEVVVALYDMQHPVQCWVEGHRHITYHNIV